MNVLIDRHHHDLFHSLQVLFGDRLGYRVYTPVGHEWWDEGYWRFGEGYGDDRLARQFLNLAGWTNLGKGTYLSADPHRPERPIRGVDVAGAKAREWAYVVATVQDNQRGFHRLANDLNAKYVLQVGNTNQAVDWGLDPLALVSSEVTIKGRGVLYHQEFDAEGVFGYTDPPAPTAPIRSLVNCFGSTPCQGVFDEVRAMLPERTFASHGIDGPDGNIETVAEIARLMRASAWGWHDKVQGDGFGHVIHDWAAIGRPLIGHAAHYRGLMAEPFWVDGVTCIDLDKHTTSEVAERLRTITATEHLAMCRAIRAVFDEHVDFGAEAERIREFLS